MNSCRMILGSALVALGLASAGCSSDTGVAPVIAKGTISGNGDTSQTLGDAVSSGTADAPGGQIDVPAAVPELPSVIARNRTIVRGFPVRQIEQDFIDITPAPTLWRVVALDYRVSRRPKMLGGVLVGGTVTAADVPAGAA